MIDPVVLIARGRYVSPPEPGHPSDPKSAEIARFEKHYFAKGRNYPLYFGGEKIGTVIVKEPAEVSCISLTAAVKVTGNVQLDSETSALALADLTPSEATPVRRAANEQERRKALDLAHSVFRAKGVGPRSLKLIKVEELVSTDVDRDENRELIGSFSVEVSQVPLTMFLIAEERAGRLVTSFTSYHRSTAPDDRRSWEFVDQIDLDADGTDEVIVTLGGYESWYYGIYKKNKKSWKLVYTGGGGGC